MSLKINIRFHFYTPLINYYLFSLSQPNVETLDFLIKFFFSMFNALKIK